MSNVESSHSAFSDYSSDEDGARGRKLCRRLMKKKGKKADAGGGDAGDKSGKSRSRLQKWVKG